MRYCLVTRICDSRRYTDRVIMRRNYYYGVKHNDGLKEIAKTIKKKCDELKNYFKKIGVSGVLIRLLGMLAVAVAGIFAAKGVDSALEYSATANRVAEKIAHQAAREYNTFKEAGPVGMAALKGLEVVEGLAKTLAKTAGNEILKREEAVAKEKAGKLQPISSERASQGLQKIANKYGSAGASNVGYGSGGITVV